MVNDYAIRGNSLVESYKKGLQDHIDLREAHYNQRHQNLVKMFEKAQRDRATTSKSVVQGSAERMKVQWEMNQQALMGKMAAALAACTD